MIEGEVIQGSEMTTVETGTVAMLNKSEIDQQIATAHRYPRSVSRFRNEMLQMVTLSEGIASECIYALPRDGKTIEGPSARFAEIAASAWGNSRAGARVVNEGAEFVTAQGVFHDLERNVAITYEVQRRITTSKGKRYGADMIAVTANAACSIALRNAILKGIPKAFWAEMYSAARHAAVGDVKSLANKRADAIKAFAAYNVSEAQILKRLGKSGVHDVGIDDLVTLKGYLTAIKEGDAAPETIFADDAAPGASVTMPRAKDDPAVTGNGSGEALPPFDANVERIAPAIEGDAAEHVDTGTGEVHNAGNGKAKAATPDQMNTPASEAQRRMIRDIAKRQGVDKEALDAALGDRFTVTLDSLPLGLVNEAIQYVRTLKPVAA